MVLRAVPTLDEQVTAYLPDKDMVVTVQRWSGFSRNRHGLVVSINERITTERTDTPTGVSESFRSYSGALAPNVITEAQARDHLTAKTGQREHTCCGADCTATLPLGRRWCTSCGRPQPAAQLTSQSGAVNDDPVLAFLVGACIP